MNLTDAEAAHDMMYVVYHMPHVIRNWGAGGSPSFRGILGGKCGVPTHCPPDSVPHTPAKDCVLCTPAFPRKDAEPTNAWCKFLWRLRRRVGKKKCGHSTPR